MCVCAYTCVSLDRDLKRGKDRCIECAALGGGITGDFVFLHVLFCI